MTDFRIETATAIAAVHESLELAKHGTWRVHTKVGRDVVTDTDMVVEDHLRHSLTSALGWPVVGDGSSGGLLVAQAGQGAWRVRSDGVQPLATSDESLIVGLRGLAETRTRARPSYATLRISGPVGSMGRSFVFDDALTCLRRHRTNRWLRAFFLTGAGSRCGRIATRRRSRWTVKREILDLLN
jgi:hypothetical protein